MASADKESLCPKNRLKLLCSYGGKILPRPSDGQLKYVGGETRVLAVARSISFPELKKRIKEMFNIAEVVIKHQIMPEDLDLLVSVTCDEDLRHMLDEYDRHDSRCPSNSPRFRLFLFSSVPPRLAPFSDAAASSIEQRYLEAINGVPPSAGLSLFAISTSAATSPTSNTNLRHPFLAAQTNHLSTSAAGGQGLHRVQSTPHLGQGLHRVRSTPNLGVATRSQMANGLGPPYGGQQQQQQHPHHHHHHHHYHDGLQAQPSAYGGGGGGPWRTESGPVRYVVCGCGCGCRVAQPPPHVVGSHYSHAARSGGCVCLGHVDDPGAALPPRTGSPHSFPLGVPRRSPRPTSWE